jgi:triacylglycerol lipase
VRLLRIPIWREGRVPLEHAALLRDPVLRGDGVPHGDGAPVLLVPGFLAGDPSMSTMAGWLKRLGYRPCRARMRANIDCETRSLDRLEESLAALSERHGRQVAVVGQSRGGAFARGLAMRRPDLVSTIVALGSPVVDQFAIHPLVRVQATALGALGTFGVPGLVSRGCTHGDCCAETRARAGEPFPEGVRFVSVYSRSDGIVDWRSCLDPAAEHVEVRSSHIGMAVHPGVYRAIARALAPRAASLRAAA